MPGTFKLTHPVPAGLSALQTRHLTRLVQDLILYEGRKSLSRLARLNPGPASRSAADDFLTEGPWDEGTLMTTLAALLFAQARKPAQHLPASVRAPCACWCAATTQSWKSPRIPITSKAPIDNTSTPTAATFSATCS